MSLVYLFLRIEVRKSWESPHRASVSFRKNCPMPGRAITYCRTSSAANIGGDSDKRQRDAIARYAKAAGLEIAAEFYDAAVSGADPVDQREGFTNLLAWARENAVFTIIVENASRFARDVVVQETGYRLLTKEGF